MSDKKLVFRARRGGKTTEALHLVQAENARLREALADIEHACNTAIGELDTANVSFDAREIFDWIMHEAREALQAEGDL